MEVLDREESMEEELTEAVPSCILERLWTGSEKKALDRHELVLGVA